VTRGDVNWIDSHRWRTKRVGGGRAPSSAHRLSLPPASLSACSTSAQSRACANTSTSLRPTARAAMRGVCYRSGRGSTRARDRCAICGSPWQLQVRPSSRRGRSTTPGCNRAEKQNGPRGAVRFDSIGSGGPLLRLEADWIEVELRQPPCAAALALPSGVLGPADRSEGRHPRIAAACSARRSAGGPP